MTRLANAEETIDWGRKLAPTLIAGDVVALTGNLGAGKTHVSKGIVAGMGCESEVSSPTFTLVHEYTGGRLPVFHFDFYRLESAADVLNIGWDDYLDGQGIVVVEWADRFAELLPPETKWFLLKVTDDGARSVETALNPLG